MDFDWEQFLDSYGVPFVVGPAKDVHSGCIGIQCPECGEADQGTHFGIRVEDNAILGCWRDKAHGMSAAKLISVLANVPYKEAKRLLEENEMPMEAVGRARRDLFSMLDGGTTKKVTTRLDEVELPESYRGFRRQPRGQERKYHRYLVDRGFARPDLLTECYGLTWGDSRVVFPLHDVHDRLVGWTGRAITETAQAKYLTLPSGEVTRHTVWNLPAVEPAEVLVLVEGPFDALKLDWFGSQHGLLAGALLGLKFPDFKTTRLIRDGRKFPRRGVMLDQGAKGQAMELQSELIRADFEMWATPEHRDDPGEMDADDVREFVASLSL